MAKVNVNGTWKDVASIQVKVNGVWESVSTAYQKMSGSWQEIYSAVVAKVLSYYGTATDLSVARQSLAGASVGNYALFAGGYTGSHSSRVDAYSSSLARTTPTGLSVSKRYLSATTVGDYALFGGGEKKEFSNITWDNTVDAYNTSLVRSTPSALSVARKNLGSASVGDYALFGGGNASTQVLAGSNVSTVNAYNTSLVRSTPTSLSARAGGSVGVSFSEYALFAGGSKRYYSSNTWYDDGEISDYVDIYNSSLVKSTPATLSIKRFNISATTVGDYALFAGGYNNYNTSQVDFFNNSFVRSTSSLSSSNCSMASVSFDDYALFAGGDNYNTKVEVFDKNLVRTTRTDDFANSCYLCGGAKIGDYALFAGGHTGSVYSNTVNVYQYK